MNARLKSLAAGVAAALLAMPVAAMAQEIHAKCDGYQVVSSQSTRGSAIFRAKVDRDSKGPKITFELTYKDLEGDIIQSHIHFSRPGSNGGIVTFLCTNAKLPNGDSNDPSRPTNPILCPGTREGTVTGTIQPENIVYIPFGNQFPPPPNGTQLIEPGEFDEVVRAIDAGATYVVVHTKAQPTGELRGQIPGRPEADEAER